MTIDFTSSEKALSQKIVAAALASCLPWEITTTGRERVWAVTVNSHAGDRTIISA